MGGNKRKGLAPLGPNKGKQKRLFDLGFNSSKQVLLEPIENKDNALADLKEQRRIKAACRTFKDAWISDHPWAIFSPVLGRVFCSICEAGRVESVFATTGSINVKKSSLIEHGGSKEHQVKLEKSLFKKEEVQKLVAKRYKHANVALFTLFRSAYFVGKSLIPYSKFLALSRLIRFVTSDITTKMYHDDKSCAKILFDINIMLQRKVLEKGRASPFFGLMIDESKDISSTGHLVVFCLYLDEGKSREVFFGFLHVAQKDSQLITTTLMSMLNEWNLDFKRCVGFGSDGASTMIGSVNGVAQRLKCLVNPHLLSFHCVAHRTNLIALIASKVDVCKEVSDEINAILNQVAAYFHYSLKRKAALSELQVELADGDEAIFED